MVVKAVQADGQGVRTVTDLQSLRDIFSVFGCGVADERVEGQRRRCILHCGAGIWNWAFPLGERPYMDVEPSQRVPAIDRDG